MRINHGHANEGIKAYFPMKFNKRILLNRSVSTAGNQTVMPDSNQNEFLP
jgi:hypothetical protein